MLCEKKELKNKNFPFLKVMISGIPKGWLLHVWCINNVGCDQFDITGAEIGKSNSVER